MFKNTSYLFPTESPPKAKFVQMVRTLQRSEGAMMAMLALMDEQNAPSDGVTTNNVTTMATSTMATIISSTKGEEHNKLVEPPPTNDDHGNPIDGDDHQHHERGGVEAYR